MLRESTGNETLEPPKPGNAEAYNILLASELIAFAQAVVENDDAGVAYARKALLKASNAAQVVDAAGIIADFQVLTRMADATGTELEERFRI